MKMICTMQVHVYQMHDYVHSKFTNTKSERLPAVLVKKLGKYVDVSTFVLNCLRCKLPRILYL